MCTNSALMSNLECYMDDLVDCFEDFVKKSLFIISVAAGALVVMLGYLLKIVADRSHPHIPPAMGVQAIEHHTAATASMNSTKSASSSVRTADLQMSRTLPGDLQMSRSSTLPQNSYSTAMPCLNNECKRTTSTAANTGPQLSIPSFDEKVLRNIGLSSCSKSCSIQGKRSVMRNCSTPRITIPSMPTCIPNHHMSTSRPCSKYIANRNSCCSMCCADDDRR